MVGDVDLKRFEAPDEVRVFEKGRLAVIRIGGMVLGRAEYEPGWRWSVHVGRLSPRHGSRLVRKEGSIHDVTARARTDGKEAGWTWLNARP
jgi:hypothetical protein